MPSEFFKIQGYLVENGVIDDEFDMMLLFHFHARETLFRMKCIRSNICFLIYSSVTTMDTMTFNVKYNM